MNDVNDNVSQEHGKKQQAVDTLKSARRIGNACIDACRKEESCHREPKRLFIDTGRADGNRQGSNQAGIADDGADGIAVGNAAVPRATMPAPSKSI